MKINIRLNIIKANKCMSSDSVIKKKKDTGCQIYYNLIKHLLYDQHFQQNDHLAVLHNTVKHWPSYQHERKPYPEKSSWWMVRMMASRASQMEDISGCTPLVIRTTIACR